MNAQLILSQIKSGNPFSYKASLSKKRVFTITKSITKDRFVLSASDLKTRQGMVESQVLNILNNYFEEINY